MNVIPPSSSNLFDVAIYNGQVPKEGPKALGVNAPFDDTHTSFVVNLLLTETQKFMSGVQAVFVDNSLNGDAVTITTATLNQQLQVPAGSQAYLPLLVADKDTITISSQGGVDADATINVPIIFCNIPLPAAVWAV